MSSFPQAEDTPPLQPVLVAPSAQADAYPAPLATVAPREGPTPTPTPYPLPPPTATLEEVRQYIVNSTLVELGRPPMTLSVDQFFAACNT